MPPKKELTKAQKKKLELEAKLKAEEERKKIEEEKAEAKRKKDEEIEMKRRAEEEQFNQQEKQRLRDEEKEYMTYDTALVNAIKKQDLKFYEEQEWKKYISKGGQTNISRMKEINELLSRFRVISRQR